MKLTKNYIDNIINTAIAEDINYLDVTTDYLIPEGHTSNAYYVAKDTGVLCGIEIAKRVFEIVGNDVDFDILIQDGTKVKKGDIIARMKGNTATLLKGERTALNILQHMSGIATATNKCVELVQGTNAQITDTRKTLPGLRALQKYAVTVGGGKNHRYNLSDGAMLKDNHIDAAVSISNAVALAKKNASFTTKVEVETETKEEVLEAINSKADIIMLDNMSPAMAKEMVDLIDGRAIVECSGNVTIENIKDYAETGTDYISVGALTHSFKVLDISLKNLVMD